jgi:hypothetical protein
MRYTRRTAGWCSAVIIGYQACSKLLELDF